MKIRALNKRKTPIVVINKSLDKMADKILFPDKIKKANQVLKTVGLPKEKLTK
ncbi:MAG: hypothetical protein IM571_09385 [Chitinophagaceae bacterium]|jgi:hypothetical protein|nr:hypothetical protein [Chitinophagaceae bacterium]MCA6489882.1 hypothetical protein [Chitinophagaceae bacterium]MCA6513803.1 hypothetical protein [Chitinophagaceae bacterium]MCA6516101.1 hypothetical protein [Chitinophagaceae bacterium]MCE2972264.1 hypothetical protein [Sediminibacterium sp.]